MNDDEDAGCKFYDPDRAARHSKRERLLSQLAATEAYVSMPVQPPPKARKVSFGVPHAPGPAVGEIIWLDKFGRVPEGKTGGPLPKHHYHTTFPYLVEVKTRWFVEIMGQTNETSRVSLSSVKALDAAAQIARYHPTLRSGDGLYIIPANFPEVEILNNPGGHRTYRRNAFQVKGWGMRNAVSFARVVKRIMCLQAYKNRKLEAFYAPGAPGFHLWMQEFAEDFL